MRTVTTNYVTIPGTEIEIETAFLPDSESDILVNRTETGVMFVGWLVDDPDCSFGNPFDDDEGSSFSDFTWLYGQRGRLYRDEHLRVMRNEHGAERVFLVDKYEHGGVAYSLAATVGYPDAQWDVASSCCVLVVPDDVTDPRAYAVGMLDTYTSWCNGDVYGIVSCTVTPDGTVSERSECWGFIGHEHAEESLKWEIGLLTHEAA